MVQDKVTVRISRMDLLWASLDGEDPSLRVCLVVLNNDGTWGLDKWET